MAELWNFARTAFIGALRAISLNYGKNALDFRQKEIPPPPPVPKIRTANLRLNLGPSDAGRLMRNRSPDAVPVRLTCHDWFRRQLVGSSKRVENMTLEEKGRFTQALEAHRAKAKLR